MVFKTMSRRAISERLVKQLLKDGQTRPVKGFKKKRDGSPFSAGLVWDNDEQRVRFWFPDRAAADRPVGPRVGQPCPVCDKGTIIKGRRSLGCSRWREGCEYRAEAGAPPR